MPYTIKDVFTFTDTGKIVENVKLNLPGLDNYDFVSNIVSAYKSVNNTLGFDFVSNNPEIVRAYSGAISELTQYPTTYVTATLTVWEQLLTKDYIEGPLMRLQAGKKYPAEKGIIDKALDSADSVTDWAGDIFSNVGEGVKNLSETAKYLPLILIAGGGLYLWLSSKK